MTPKENDLIQRVKEQETAARAFGFYWEHLDQLIEQIQSECQEIQEAWQTENRPHLQEEVGDLLLAALSLAIFCDLDPHETLHHSIEKFQKRYNQVVSLANQDGLTHLHGKSTQELLEYWNRAKKNLI